MIVLRAVSRASKVVEGRKMSKRFGLSMIALGAALVLTVSGATAQTRSGGNWSGRNNDNYQQQQQPQPQQQQQWQPQQQQPQQWQPQQQQPQRFGYSGGNSYATPDRGAYGGGYERRGWRERMWRERMWRERSRRRGWDW